MQPFQPLNSIEPQDWFSKSLRSAVTAVNKAIADLLSRREASDAEYEKISSGTADPSAFVLEADCRAERYRIMADELALRRGDLANVLAKALAEIAKVKDAAFHSIDKAKANVKADLIAIGFVDTGDRVDSRVPGSIAPGLVNGHPRVIEARNRHEALVPDIWRQRIAANEEAIEAIEADMRDLRTRLTK